MDFSPHRIVLAVDLDLLCPMHHGIPPGSRGLEAGKDDAMPLIRQQGLEMVKHSPSCSHATCRNDDGRIFLANQLNRLFRRADKLGPAVDLVAVSRIQTMLLVEAVEDLRCADGHGAVQVHGYIGNPQLFFQLLNDVKEIGRASCGKECRSRWWTYE